MKKTYIQPTLSVFMIEARQYLLAGSGTQGDTKWDNAFSNEEAGLEDVAGARSFGGIWDDDE